jgi:hypothetical protein
MCRCWISRGWNQITQISLCQNRSIIDAKGTADCWTNQAPAAFQNWICELTGNEMSADRSFFVRRSRHESSSSDFKSFIADAPGPE